MLMSRLPRKKWRSLWRSRFHHQTLARLQARESSMKCARIGERKVRVDTEISVCLRWKAWSIHHTLEGLQGWGWPGWFRLNIGDCRESRLQNETVIRSAWLKFARWDDHQYFQALKRLKWDSWWTTGKYRQSGPTGEPIWLHGREKQL